MILTIIMLILIVVMVLVIAAMLIRAWQEPDLRKLIKFVSIVIIIAIVLFTTGLML
jgi:threonine/homoserine/homoserine lactone efflux protein